MHRRLTKPKANLTTPKQTLKKPQADLEPTTATNPNIPKCIHVLGLRVQTSAIGKRTFFSCIVRAHRLSEGAWSTVHKETTNVQRHAWKTSHEDSTYFPCYQSAVWSGKCRVCGVRSGKCRVWSVECKVRSVECKVWSGECRMCEV